MTGRGEDARRKAKRLRCSGRAAGRDVQVERDASRFDAPRVTVANRLLTDHLVSTEELESLLREHLELPRGYHISHEGEIKQMGESFGRLIKALGLGLALLFLSLAVTFRSFLRPVAILATLPLALIGAAWAMMIANKHGCMPSFMGLILLMGIVVNNGILLVDFIQTALNQGKPLNDAIIQAVQLRTRPILMTAGSTIVGMIPIAMEWAVGIERLSPLAVVAIGGLLAGTFLTLLVVPVLFHALESGRRRWSGA